MIQVILKQATFNRVHCKLEPGRQLQVATPSVPEIAIDTELVSVEDAVQQIRQKKGLKLSPKTIRVYCRTGKWQQSTHWVKNPGKYQISRNAVFWSIAQSQS